MNKFDIKKLLENIKNPTILEIGANDGKDSEEFLKIFKKIKLFCFEPDPRAILLFKSRVIKKYSKKVKLFEMAISNKDGYINFWMSDSDSKSPVGKDWNKSGSIKQPLYHLIYHKWCKFNKVINVKTLKLDTWVKENDIDIIDFIWADVQGAEVDLINGGIDTLNNKVRYFYTEYSNIKMYASDSSIKAITNLLPNFEIVKIFDNDILLKNKKLTIKE